MDFIQGIDISLWDDDNSTPQMCDPEIGVQAGLGWVGIKVSQDRYLDPDYIMNWRHYKDRGVPRLAYHFYDWSADPNYTQGAKLQARFYAGALKADPGELPPCNDYEMRTGIPPRQIAVNCQKIFLQEVEDILGILTSLYTSLGMWNEFGWREGDSSADGDFWAKHGLWLAQYSATAAAGNPTVPKPWKTWTLLQYDSVGHGKEFGCESVDVDRNYFNGNAAAFEARFKCKLPAKTVPITPPGPVVPPISTSTILTVTTDMLRLRAGPGLDYATLGMLKQTSWLNILDRKTVGNDLWIQVPGGWMAERYLGQILAKES